MSRRHGIGLALGLAAAAPLWITALPAVAQAGVSLLDKLERGAWEVRFRDGSGSRRICLRDGSELVQLKHSGRCNRFVVEDGASQVTIQYTCRGNGYGRTSLRRETASIVQIESQGIESGEPFSFSAEARRTGSCS